MATTTPVPTLPGATEAQVVAAMTIARRVYSEHGIDARIEPHLYRDPELGDYVVELVATVSEKQPVDAIDNVTRAVDTELYESGLAVPAVPITTHINFP